ncbi:MAG: family 20 glycosylhydrolase, partial [Gemmatimonadota bacterium]|nr:family 20 glycosylhydrolase [Gemmatimonadota bacterium]
KRACLSLIVLLPLAAAAQAPRLIPAPREFTAGPAAPLKGAVAVTAGADKDDKFAAADLAASLSERGAKVAAAGSGLRIQLLRASSVEAKTLLAARKLEFDGAMKDEGYIVIADPKSIKVIGATAAGVFYGAQTAAQLITGHGAALAVQTGVIRDWPAMRWRGFHDDLSRGPVPTLEFQKRIIRTIAAFKMNAYSPYFEHTLAYDSDPLIAPPSGAMTREQVKELVAYAKPFHVEIIPEQEAFGHLHHALKYEIYSKVAETPHGHVLAPGQPESMNIIKRWFAEIDSMFPSQFVHLGADETFELGKGQTKEAVTRDGIGPVYLKFLGDIQRSLRAQGSKKTFLFWADIAEKEPKLVSSLPQDMIAVAWNYWSTSGFEKSLTPFSGSGMQTWVAPGVSNWSMTYPDNNIALKNIQGFVRDGQKLGASGMLNTSWGDDGEEIFNQTWYGVVFGAAASWQKGEASIPDYQKAFGLQFHGDTTGKIDAAQQHLMAAHAALSKAGAGNGHDFLYWVDPYSSEGMEIAKKVRVAAPDLRIHAESASILIAQARRVQPNLRWPDALDAMDMGARRLDLIGMKFQFADEMVKMYQAATDPARTAPVTWLDFADISGINGRLQTMREAYVLGRELYEKSWRAENRPYWMHNVITRYDTAIELWWSRSQLADAARREFSRTKKVPPAERMGIPASMP